MDIVSATEAALEADRPAGTLMLHLLGRCNLECLHCYMEGGPARREELRLDDVVAAIGECKAIGIGQLYLTGGEPFLYAGLDEALRVATAAGLKITVCSNGSVRSARHVEALREAGARAQVSVDGPEAFHDEFRRHAGAFRATERGIRTFREAGLPVTIVMTVSRGNLDSLSSMVEWAHGI